MKRLKSCCMSLFKTSRKCMGRGSHIPNNNIKTRPVSYSNVSLNSSIGVNVNSTTTNKMILDNIPIINSYMLTNSLQNGYSGQVFKGLYIKNNKPIVVKCCSKKSSWDRETSALQYMNHENIIKMVGKPNANLPFPKNLRHTYNDTNQVILSNTKNKKFGNKDIKILDTVHVLGLEYAYYGDLYEIFMQEGVFSENCARFIFKQIVSGLLYAYEHGSCGGGISHRDIKLENIFVMEDGNVKIGDWGLCAFDTKNRLCTSSCGTLGYMAPELLCRQSYKAEKVDVWSLGVVLFSMVFGIRPYTDPKFRQRNPNDFNWRDVWLNAILLKQWDKVWLSHGRDTMEVEIASPELKDLIEIMFDGNCDRRASLRDLYNHPWVVGENQKKYTKEDFVKDILKGR